MTSVTRVCEKCGAKISSWTRSAVCPACLLETGLGLFSGESVAGTSDAGCDDSTRVADRTKSKQSTTTLVDFGDYELLEEIGRGGQGVVYRAHQKSLNRTVALKVIGLGYWANEADLKRFRREAEAAASLDHPCIVPIYEVGERDGQCYFSMKFVEGGQLDEVVSREAIPIRRAVELIAKLARTVHHAHEHGILHRDIKPGNILLDQEGEPLLTDFGLARLVETESTITRTLEVMGTPSYMAPEQAAGETGKLNKATDIYGLGAVLYQLLTGHPPFAGGTTYETIRLVLDTEPRQPRLWNRKIDRDLSTISLTCLEKDPKRRYSSALALAQDLEHWLKHEPIRAHHTGIFTRGRKWMQRNQAVAALIASLIVLVLVIGWTIWKSDLFRPPPEKSIAVLPFENLSRDPNNAYFADGVQDEILTDLSRIADLKVIGRTSVMQYKSGVARNLREISDELGVAHLVQGSVQRAGNRVRVNAQLFDARTERSLWGQTYDGDIADFFAIQSRIAIAIADALHAQLSANEKSEIERPATKDITAIDLYTRARQLFLTPGFLISSKPTLLQAENLLNESVARDPSFFRAYCQLAFVHDSFYFYGFDNTPARLALAEAALEMASRLRPDAGETHLARAWNLYWGHLDYDGALGHWEESTRTFERAADLDPRNFAVLQNIEGNYATLWRYPEQQVWLGRILALEPEDAVTKAILAAVDFEWKADTRPLHQIIDSIRATNPAAVREVDHWWLQYALAERDTAAATDALIAAGEDPINLGNDIFCTRQFVEGVINQMAKDDDKARAAFTAARAEQEKIVQVQPDFGPPWSVLGLIDAALGRKEEALREGQRAVELLPVEKDALRGPALIKYLAMIAAWVGDKDLACQQLAIIARPPSPVTYGQLKLMPFWDPLRGDPRFEQIVVSLTPEGVARSTPEKSIAVLPFEYLSDDKKHAFFADGVQDDVLTKLAKVADLKVISRASVMPYRGKHDVGQIGRELGVSHLLKGTVQRSHDKVHVNAQLVDARTGTNIWAEEYDRNLNEVFAIETELAQTVANRLKANVSANETLAMRERPTSDLAAFDLYTRAQNLLAIRNARANLLEAADLLNQAVSGDPSFFKAYCQLAHTHDRLYFLGYDHTPARLALAEGALQVAFRLHPDAGEAHLARAQHLYRGYLNYAAALTELEIAAKTLPNDAGVFELKGYIQRRQGKQQEALRSLERAAELDPRDTFLLQQVALSYHHLRRYAEETSVLDRALAIAPDDVDIKAARASADYHWKADTRSLHQTIEFIRATKPTAMASMTNWLTCALAERDAAAAKNAVTAAGENPPLTDGAVNFSRQFIEGLIARMTKDDEKARAAFTAARTEQAKIVQAQPGYGPPLCVLGLIDAALGRKDEALREGRRAVELLPVEKDAINGVAMTKYLAVIAAWVGDKDLACQQLAIAIRLPSRLTYGQLKLLPWWDPLRGDRRFERIVASLAPESVGENPPDKSIAVQPVAGPTVEKSIAVLSFENLIREPDSAYLVDGIRGQIVARLGKIANLKIVSGRSTDRYPNTPENPAQVAAELGVALILQGSVEKQGEKFRIAVRLIDARNNADLWRESYDCTFSELNQSGSLVLRHVANALGVRLTDPESRAIGKTATPSPPAYEAYLKGRYVWLQRKWEGYRQAKEYFEQAIALDPNYAQAYAGLADAYQFLAAGGGVYERRENYDKAKSAYKRALEIDPMLAQAHASAGLVAMNYDWDWPLAEQELRRAIALDPNEALLYDWYAEYLMAVGRTSESIGNMERARDLDPLSIIINSDLGKMFYFARRYDEAEKQLKETLRMDPDFEQAHRYLGGVYVMKSRFDDAIAEFKVAAANDEWDPGFAAYAYGMAGRKAEAAQMLERTKKFFARRGDFDKFSLALAYIGSGQTDRAIECLGREYEDHSTGMTSLKSNPEYDSLRSDPRFLDLMRRVHLAQK